MKIKLKCKNCGYVKEIYNEELYLHRECPICSGRKLEIVNLDEVIKQYIEENKRYNLYKSFRTLGIERTLEVINKHHHLKIGYRDLINNVFKRRMI